MKLAKVIPRIGLIVQTVIPQWLLIMHLWMVCGYSA